MHAIQRAWRVGTHVSLALEERRAAELAPSIHFTARACIWQGHKFHLDIADGDIPICAACHAIG